MGTGKTKLTLDTAAWLFQQEKINGLLVAAPKSICRVWADKEIQAHLLDSINRHVVLWGSPTKKLERALEKLMKPTAGRLDVLVINIEALATDRGYDAVAQFLKTHAALFAIDESTTIKNIDSKRTKIAIKLGKLALYRRILTGTPVTQSPLDLYAQTEFLKPGVLGHNSYFGFRNNYSVLQRKYVNGRHFDVVIGYQRLDDLLAKMRAISTRALKKDCLDLPEKLYTVREVELTIEQRRYYQQLEEECLAFLQSGEAVATPLVITQILRLRQALCNLAPLEDGQTKAVDDKSDPRTTEVLNILQEAGDQKVLIWATFRPSIERLQLAIAAEFGEASVAVIHGDVSQKQRQELVTTFQDASSPLRYLVMQPLTAGYGLTLTVATLVVYHDNDWSLAVRQQSEDRAHRIGQTQNVTYIDLVAPGTIDETIRAALMQKRDLAALVTGDTLKQLLQKPAAEAPE